MNVYTQSSDSSFSETEQSNLLAQFIQSLPEDAIARMHEPNPEAAQLMHRNLANVFGVLPSDQFQSTVTTSREALAQLVASAMKYGYFLHASEQRLSLKNTFSQME
jgi:hypothetical protein